MISNKIVEYIKYSSLLNVFFNDYFKKNDYQINHVNLDYFVEYLQVRYEINLDNNFLIHGGKELIENLKKHNEKIIKAHHFNSKNNSITIFSNSNNDIIYGYLAIKTGKVYGEIK